MSAGGGSGLENSIGDAMLACQWHHDLALAQRSLLVFFIDRVHWIRLVAITVTLKELGRLQTEQRSLDRGQDGRSLK